MYLKVIENLLEETLSNEIEQHILNNNKFVWFFEPSALADADNINYHKTPFFVHPLLMDGRMSNEYALCEIIASKIVQYVGEPMTLHSSNVNLLPENKQLADELADAHVDRMYTAEMYDTYDTYTAVYYVNDTPDKTIMYNELFDPSVGLIEGPFTNRTEVPSKKNTLVIFDSRIYHSAPSASSKGYRSVINFNLMVPKVVAS